MQWFVVYPQPGLEKLKDVVKLEPHIELARKMDAKIKEIEKRSRKKEKKKKETRFDFFIIHKNYRHSIDHII